MKSGRGSRAAGEPGAVSWPILRHARTFGFAPALSHERADSLAALLLLEWQHSDSGLEHRLLHRLSEMQEFQQTSTLEGIRLHYELQAPTIDFPEYRCMINDLAFEFRPCLTLCGSGESSKAWVRICTQDYRNQPLSPAPQARNRLWSEYLNIAQSVSSELVSMIESKSASWMNERKIQLCRHDATLDIYSVGSADRKLERWIDAVGNPASKEEARQISVDDALLFRFFKSAAIFEQPHQLELEKHPEAFWKPITATFPVPDTTVLEDAPALYYLRTQGSSLQAFGMGYHPQYPARLAYDSSLAMARSLGRNL